MKIYLKVVNISIYEKKKKIYESNAILLNLITYNKVLSENMIFKIGTSGCYRYNDWKGNFYPESTPRGKMLDFYSSVFNTVEKNTACYKTLHPAVFCHLSKKLLPDVSLLLKLIKRQPTPEC